ncbi:MAG: nucleotidyltransferase domain-containing protein [Anaerolineae bacterium]|nr:nucleotidyltransferase domain-containing protein [Anaerolineae bacterium]MCB0227994.1 nucleotidyltransferase domain-containing protein [Anaerolineae bacterium]MCB0246611.1 nucleotidyltransferase domain-containing protein [Anaerolineae bacterium]MCB9140851.1 nucleotidyltransferase domain-containing protein [Anaerolineales bacterium]MCO5246263.1 nucleotidyltransferase domain-containing protein [Anaerolineae bacterium]
MVKADTGVKAIVERYCNELDRMGIHCERVLLFGSQAEGRAKEGSDIDLIVISPMLATLSNRERLELLGVAAARILEPIQAFGVTPDEAAARRVSPFVQDLLDKQAVVIL